MPEASLLIIFITSMAVALSGAMMPGPLLTVAISETARRGFLMSPLLILGHGIVELGVVIGLVLGLGELLQRGPVMGTVSLLGGGFLLWMGYGLVRAAWLKQVSLPGAVAGRPAMGGPVLTGILVSVSNPYWSLWWVTIGASYVAWAMHLGQAGLASFYGGHILADLGWYSLVGLMVVTGRRVLSDTVYRGILLVCGAFLLALAVYFLASGIGFWTR